MKKEKPSDLDEFLISLNEENKDKHLFKGYIEYSGAFFILAGICFPFEWFTIPGILLLLLAIITLILGIREYESWIKSSESIGKIFKISSSFWVLIICFLHYSHFILVLLDQRQIIVALYSLLVIVQSIAYVSFYIFLRQISKNHPYTNRNFNWIFILYAISSYARIGIYIGYNFREVSYYIVQPIDGFLLILMGIVLIRVSILFSKFMKKIHEVEK